MGRLRKQALHLRSWVQLIPPGPLFPVVQLREQVTGCSKKLSPLDFGCIYITLSLFTLARTLKLWLRYQILKRNRATLPFPLCKTVDAFRIFNLTYCYQVVKEC